METYELIKTGIKCINMYNGEALEKKVNETDYYEIRISMINN